mmetsp:Transcript_22227/g.54698  ORF Transcript_22227/g.54698 Transcript_22227/m.54698 type:complete len:99 (+) Transcript_22227:949-1245(+)
MLLTDHIVSVSPLREFSVPSIHPPHPPHPHTWCTRAHETSKAWLYIQGPLTPCEQRSVQYPSIHRRQALIVEWPSPPHLCLSVCLYCETRNSSSTHAS